MSWLSYKWCVCGALFLRQLSQDKYLIIPRKSYQHFTVTGKLAIIWLQFSLRGQTVNVSDLPVEPADSFFILNSPITSWDETDKTDICIWMLHQAEIAFQTVFHLFFSPQGRSTQLELQMDTRRFPIPTIFTLFYRLCVLHQWVNWWSPLCGRDSSVMAISTLLWTQKYADKSRAEFLSQYTPG